MILIVLPLQGDSISTTDIDSILESCNFSFQITTSTYWEYELEIQIYGFELEA